MTVKLDALVEQTIDHKQKGIMKGYILSKKDGVLRIQLTQSVVGINNTRIAAGIVITTRQDQCEIKD